MPTSGGEVGGHYDQDLHGEATAVARRRGEVAAAGHAGDEPSARVALLDPDATVRSTALGALVRMERVSLADLAGALLDRSAVLRRRAAELSWRCRLEAAAVLRLLEPRLQDDEPLVVEASCAALGELAPGAGPEVEESAARALAGVAAGHADPLCREAAVAALGAIGHPASLPVVLGRLGDRPQVRRRAVLALASYAGPEVEAALEAAARDRDWQVRQAAEDVSDRRAGEDRPPLSAR